MRYRALNSSGDFVFGRGMAEYLVNSPAAVAQAVQTALLLHQGEWFLDLTVGMPWETQVIGYNTKSLYDAAIKNQILGVQGVRSILAYSSSLNTATRLLSVQVTINTIFGQTTTSINAFVPPHGYGIDPYGEFPYGGSL